jgi:mRNA interferase MazF
VGSVSRAEAVVSVDDFSTGEPDELIVIVPLSSSRAPSALRPEVPVGDGIDRPSRAICRGIRSVARARLLRRVGVLPPDVLTEVERVLGLILGLANPPPVNR